MLPLEPLPVERKIKLKIKFFEKINFAVKLILVKNNLFLCHGRCAIYRTAQYAARQFY